MHVNNKNEIQIVLIKKNEKDLPSIKLAIESKNRKKIISEVNTLKSILKLFGTESVMSVHKPTVLLLLCIELVLIVNIYQKLQTMRWVTGALARYVTFRKVTAVQNR